jgi:sugar phosphate permease
MFLDYTYLMWTPTFLFEAFGLTVVKAGIFSSIYPLVGLVARPLGGYLSDFFFRRRETLMLIGLTSLTVLTFALSCALSSLTGTILVLGFIAFFSQLITMLFFVSMADLFTAEFAGSGAGFTDAIGHVGTISAMVIAGIVIDTFHSYRLLFMILSGVALLGTMCMVLKPER